MTRLAALALVGLALLTLGARWDYSRADAEAALVGASDLMLCVVARESGGDPNAVGDYGQSYGLVQLYRFGGAWPRFFSRYSDPFDPAQATAFLREEIAAGRGAQWSTYYGCGGR